MQALAALRGSQRVTSDNPEDTYEALKKYGSDLVGGDILGSLDGLQGFLGKLVHVHGKFQIKPFLQPTLCAPFPYKMSQLYHSGGILSRLLELALHPAGSVWVLLLSLRGFSLVEIGLAESLFHVVSLWGEAPSGLLLEQGFVGDGLPGAGLEVIGQGGSRHGSVYPRYTVGVDGAAL